MFLAVYRHFITAIADLNQFVVTFKAEVKRTDISLAEEYGVYFTQPESNPALKFLEESTERLTLLLQQVPNPNSSSIPTPPQYNDSYKIGVKNIVEGLESYVSKVKIEARKHLREYKTSISNACSERRDFEVERGRRSGYISRRSILGSNDDWDEWDRRSPSTSYDYYSQPKPFTAAGYLADKHTATAVYTYLETNLAELLNYDLVLEVKDYTIPKIRYKKTWFIPFRKTKVSGFIRRALNKLPV